MNIGRATLIIVAGVMTASCSEKPGVDRNQNAKAEEAKPSQDFAAGNENRTKKSEVERSSTSETDSVEAERENERQPPADEIGEDCVAFLRSTKTGSGNGANADCPQCPVDTEAKEVLKFDKIRVDRVVCSGSSCEVNVTIHATFNPSTRESIVGGLTAWISPEQKAKYSRGETPSGEQTYKVKVTYRLDRKGWRAVEFDRP